MNPRSSKFPWPQWVSWLKHEAGKSDGERGTLDVMAQRLAAASSLPVSRNMIGSKLAQLGISVASEAKPRQKRERKQKTAVLVPLQPPLEHDAAIPLGQRCTLLELAEGKCRWPIGDPRDGDNFHFCGGKSIEGLPYCGYHSRIAYQPAVERRLSADGRR